MELRRRDIFLVPGVVAGQAFLSLEAGNVAAAKGRDLSRT
jgi:hypothetical protein